MYDDCPRPEDGGTAPENGPTAHGTFIGTCTNCGAVWEFGNGEVIPVPFPHGTCPNCGQWVAVF